MNLTQLNILLADDDTDDRLFFDKALKELPISTHLTTVDDEEQLMNYLSNHSENLANVIFLDINMPRKNGLECLSEIKQNKNFKNLPVVIFSTTNSIDTISTLFKSGVDVYIRKPGDFEPLKQVIHHALPMATEKIISRKYVNDPNEESLNSPSQL